MNRIWTGGALVVLGVAAVGVLGLVVPKAMDTPNPTALAPFGLVPIVVGAALLLVGLSDGHQSDGHLSDGHLSRGRHHRLLIGALATGVGIVTLAAAVVAVVPAVSVSRPGQTLAVGLQDVDPDGTAHDPSADGEPTLTPTPTPDAGGTAEASPASIPIHRVLDAGDVLAMNCGTAVGGADGDLCWSWTFTAPSDCTAKVTIGFGEPSAATTERSITRFVSLGADVPLSLAVHGTGAAAGIQDAACVRGGDAPQPLGVDYPDTELPDADFPAACDDWGCDGIVFGSWMDCPAATVQVGIDDDVEGHRTRDYAVVEAIRSSSFEEPNEVFVPWHDGVQPAYDEVSSVTCED